MQKEPTTMLSDGASALAEFSRLAEVFSRDMRAVKKRCGKISPFETAAHTALNSTAWQILEFPCVSLEVAFAKARFVLVHYSFMAWLSRDERALTVLMESFLEIQSDERFGGAA